MASPTEDRLSFEELYDPAQPFKGVVICCTSIPAELRADIDNRTKELGGIHKYDLTPDVTHLIVGEYDTPKYRHVAKERPDIRAMAAGWVNAVMQLWMEDAEIDLATLEQQWQLLPFQTSGGDPNAPEDAPEHQAARLICSVSGFDEIEERQAIIQKIEAYGGVYTGDLTRRATHLIVRRPEGKKYAAAKKWEIHTVVPRWLDDSIARGMILNESYYDPCLPPDEIGVGAWNKRELRRVSLGKRLREGAAAAQEQGKRKLRKTASMKLSSQRDNLWGDILGSKPGPPEEPLANESPFAEVPTQPATGMSLQQRQSMSTSRESGSGPGSGSLGGSSDGNSVFASCGFYIHGFSEQKTEILVNTVSCLGGLVCQSLEEVVSASGAQLSHRLVLVPQKSSPESHPRIPDTVYIVTEFYIEKCLHRKHFVSPTDHVIGRPFPVFPIEGFETLTICTAGFTGVDLNQADKAIRQLGAKYEERFTAQISVLVCSSLAGVRKQKLDLAIAWKVPIINTDWLWECISTGFKVPIKGFLFKELKQKLSPDALELRDPSENKLSSGAQSPSQTSFTADGRDSKKQAIRDIDTSAFESDVSSVARATGKHAGVTKQDSIATEFETAPTHLSRGETASNDSGPLSEVSSNALNNRSPVRQLDKAEKSVERSPRPPISRVTSEIADSEATDGDVGDSTLLLAVEETEQLLLQNLEPQAETRKDPETQQQSAAEEKRARHTAERIALGTKFTNLFDAPATGSSEVSAEGLARTTSVPPTLGGRPPRRKREILGRAISNVSVGSAGSTDEGVSGSNKAASAAASFTAALAASGASGGLVGDGSAVDATVSDPDSATKAPASTQLEYIDDGARLAQEKVLSKLTGANTRTRAAQARAEAAMTIGDVAGIAGASSDAPPELGRRITRRRGQ